MPFNKSISLLLLGAIASGAAAVYFTNDFINTQVNSAKDKYKQSQNQVPIKVVVASHHLKKGDVLSYENLSLRDMPSKYIHESAILSKHASDIIGQRIIHDLNKGEALLSSFITQSNHDSFAYLIKEGERAITFPVDMVSSMSGLLRPGNRIDLMFTLRGDKQLTRALLHDVTVLATGDSVDNESFNNKGKYQTITVAVTPENASRITLARNIGTLSVVLRSAQDKQEYKNENNESKPVNINNLFREKTKVYKNQRKVEIIVGG